MRSSKSRQRSKQNRPRTLGNIINRVFDSSGPEGKVRGTPQQIIEKYQHLARDAQVSNDRVAAENFQQHAEHYTRMLGEAMREMAAEQEARQQQFGQNGGQNGQNGHNGNRDQRDNRPWRDDRGPDAGNGDQPDMAHDPRGEDTGLVETPEARRDSPPADAPRRDDRREDRPRRNDRPEGDRNRNRDDARNTRGPRPPRPDRVADGATERAPADRPSEPAVGATEPASAPVAPPAPKTARQPAVDSSAAAPVAAAQPEAEAKPRRPRAPRKPKVSDDGGSSGGGDSGPREAAE